MKKYVMALDQGTTSSRCILFNEKGEVVNLVQKEYEQIFPKQGWVEHDPWAIWKSQISVAAECLEKSGVNVSEVSGIGITNQRETTIIWDKNTGEPVYNAIVWQCRRTAPIVEQIGDDMSGYIKKITGLIPDAYFSASKIKWILDNVEGAREKANKGELLFGTVDSWLMWNLSEGEIHATDYTNASRTMLFDIEKLEWDKKILDYFNIPLEMMPEVHPSGYNYGTASAQFFDVKIPITAVAGDQQASLFGLGCFDKGDTKNTYGTGCFLLMNTGKEIIRSENGLVSTIAAGFDADVDYVIEGSVFMGGAIIKWLRDQLQLIDNAAETEELAVRVPDSNGVYLVPAFTGLGAPYWNPDARGLLVGMTRGFSREHLIRAALESITYQVCDVLKAMEKDSKVKIEMLKVDGGASANDLLVQLQSDILNIKINRPSLRESTGLGAAFLAGITAGLWKNKEEVKTLMTQNKVFEPLINEEERLEKLKGWEKAVKTAIYWAE